MKRLQWFGVATGRAAFLTALQSRASERYSQFQRCTAWVAGFWRCWTATFSAQLSNKKGSTRQCPVQSHAMATGLQWPWPKNGIRAALGLISDCINLTGFAPASTAYKLSHLSNSLNRWNSLTREILKTARLPVFTWLQTYATSFLAKPPPLPPTSHHANCKLHGHII